MASIAVEPRLPSTGDAHEAGRLYAEHSERLFGYCLRQLGSPVDAEDAVQTTFVYALRALQRGVVPECESAWLHSVAKNVCRWQRRTAARRDWLSSDVIEDVADAPADDESERELWRELHDALGALPERQRRALVLRELQGLPSREVAARLGMSASATYALLTRARYSLAQALTATARRPALSLNFGPLLLKLKGLFLGGAANAVATTAVFAGMTVGGGIAVEKAIHDDFSRAQRVSATPLPAAAEMARTSAMASSVGETAAPVVASASTRSVRVDAAGGPQRSEGATTPTRRPLDPTELPLDPTEPPGSMNDPQSPEAQGSDASVSQPTASLLPGVELPPVPVIGPPAELPGDLPQPPPVDGGPLLDEVAPNAPAPPAVLEVLAVEVKTPALP